MARRVRTTKSLAQRIDREYFKKLYPMPRWRRILSIGFIALALMWLGWGAVTGKRTAFNAGPLAKSHAMLGSNCGACHVASAFSQKVTDQACLACHDGPVHQARQPFTPSCQSCHVEHLGSFRLASVSSENCAACHADLKTTNGRARVNAHIRDIADHPEFRVLSAGGPDPGTIKFGHQVHLKKNLRGLTGPVTLQCSDCHSRDGAAMTPVNFERHCASCHPLQFDKRFTVPVPHKKPEVVHAFLVDSFTSYAADHPNEIRLPDSPNDPRIMAPHLRPALNASEWIARRIQESERLLWRKTCVECHTLKASAAQRLPDVPKAMIAARWLPKASFDHEAHQMLKCVECHAHASASKEARDVLLPGIQVCRQCHHSGGDAAGAECSECHVYHDWAKEKPVAGKFTIPGLRGRAE